MNDLRKLPVDDGIDDQRLVFKGFIQRLVDLVLGAYVADAPYAGILAAKLGQGGGDRFFRCLPRGIGQEKNILSFRHVRSYL